MAMSSTWIQVPVDFFRRGTKKRIYGTGIRETGFTFHPQTIRQSWVPLP